MKKLKLRCYVCGKPIGRGKFVLVSPSPNEIDRVFVIHGGDCLADVQEDQPSLSVRTQD